MLQNMPWLLYAQHKHMLPIMCELVQRKRILHFKSITINIHIESYKMADWTSVWVSIINLWFFFFILFPLSPFISFSLNLKSEHYQTYCHCVIAMAIATAYTKMTQKSEWTFCQCAFGSFGSWSYFPGCCVCVSLSLSLSLSLAISLFHFLCHFSLYLNRLHSIALWNHCCTGFTLNMLYTKATHKWIANWNRWTNGKARPDNIREMWRVLIFFFLLPVFVVVSILYMWRNALLDHYVCPNDTCFNFMHHFLHVCLVFATQKSQ